jgi:hypothetical protein
MSLPQAAKLGINMEPFIPWTNLSLAKLIDKTAE